MFKKNKSILFLLVVIVCFALVACSGNNGDEEDQLDDFDLDIAVGDGIGNSVTIPDDYPSDILPIYKGSYVFSVVEYEESFTITAFTKDDYDTVIEFYKDLLENAETAFEVNTAEGYTRSGTIDNFTYNLSVILSDEFDDYPCAIGLMVMPAQ